MTISKEVMIKQSKPSTEMKTKICLLASLAFAAICPSMLAQETSAAGSVYGPKAGRSEEHTSELQSLRHLVCRLLLEKKKKSSKNTKKKKQINIYRNTASQRR